MIEREEDQEKNRGFKVDDRRRFSAEGDLKAEHQAQEPVQPAAPAARGAAAAAAGSHHPRQRAPDRVMTLPPEISFVGFVVSLSTQALMHLGEIPDPMTNQPERDLQAAQHIIDILGMLQEKTRGNLDQEEESLVRSILFDLRMKYVETARHHPV